MLGLPGEVRRKHAPGFPHISLHVLLRSTVLAEPDHTRTLHELKMFTLNESSATRVLHMGQIHIWLASSYLWVKIEIGVKM